MFCKVTLAFGGGCPPQQLDQPAGRHRLVGVQQRPGQQGSLLGRADGNEPLAVPDLQRSEDAKSTPTAVSP